MGLFVGDKVWLLWKLSGFVKWKIFVDAEHGSMLKCVVKQLILEACFRAVIRLQKTSLIVTLAALKVVSAPGGV